MPSAKTMNFYFDPVSPYAYLASTQLPQLIERTGAQVTCIPVLFAGFLKALGNKGPAEIASKKIHTMKDAVRFAKLYQVPIEGPPEHPFNPLNALRMCCAIEDDEGRLRFASALMKACWGYGNDITDVKVLAAIAKQSRLDDKILVEKMQDPSIKKRLKDNTEEALQQGVFGVPTFQVGDELFWGNDRFDFVEQALAGKDPLDAAQAQRILSRTKL